MSRKTKRAAETESNPPNKKSCQAFKPEWLQASVEIEKGKGTVHVKLEEIFEYKKQGGLKCKICAEAKIIGEFSKGKTWIDWKLDYLKRHVCSKLHKQATSILQTRKACQSSGNVCQLLLESAADKEERQNIKEKLISKPDEVKVLIDNVLHAVNMNTSMNAVQKINDHMAKYVNIPESWRSKNYAFEFLQNINAVVQSEILTEIRESKYHTLVVDESTDISVSKMLILYFKYRKTTSDVHQTMFGGILNLISCTACAIVTAIKEFYSFHKLDLMRMVMFTSDGASVMLGRCNGVAAQLKQIIPHLTEQHCVAHREDLGIGDAWKRVPVVKEIETLLRTVYTVFCRSSTKKAQFREMANVTEHKAVSFKPLNEVRWLSRYFAVKALMQNYEALIFYFENEVSENNDPISKYCLKRLTDKTNRVNVAVLHDVLYDLSELTKSFQKTTLTTLEAVDLARAKIEKLKNQYLGEEIYWGRKVQDLISELFGKDEKFNSQSIIQFITLLCEHMCKRFPKQEIKEWAVFDFNTVTSKNTQFSFGRDLLNKLIERYGNAISCSSLIKSPNLMEDMDRSTILEQFQNFKCIIMEKKDSKVINCFQDMVSFGLQSSDKFGTISNLLDICGTFQASSADCERGFSLMNSIKIKSRNRLQETHLDMLMRIKFFLLDGRSVDLNAVHKEWKNFKDRREKVV
ncbi:E3 SUMO-protein ligase KIAA1586-like [Ciona intestinalis]